MNGYEGLNSRSERRSDGERHTALRLRGSGRSERSGKRRRSRVMNDIEGNLIQLLRLGTDDEAPGHRRLRLRLNHHRLRRRPARADRTQGAVTARLIRVGGAVLIRVDIDGGDIEEKVYVCPGPSSGHRERLECFDRRCSLPFHHHLSHTPPFTHTFQNTRHVSNRLPASPHSS